MHIARLLKTSGLAAVAFALAVPILSTPAAAQDQLPRNRGEEARERMRDARQDARQIDRRSERQADRIEDRGDRRADRAADSGNWGRAARVDNRSERTANQVERQGDRRAAQTVREARRDVRNGEPGGTYSSSRDRDRDQWRGRDRDGNRWGDNDRRDYRDNDRNRDYRNDQRNRDYRGNNWDRGRDGYREARRDHRRWDRNDWRRDRRYNWNHHRTVNVNLYRPGRYYSPYRNYTYRRINIGIHLDSPFYSNRYWINDPWQYRLPEVYGPYRWVRYYDDVLLVDMYSGEVVDVIHDFFW